MISSIDKKHTKKLENQTVPIHPRNPLGLGLSLRTQASPPTALCATAPRFIQFWHFAASGFLSWSSCPSLYDEGKKEWKYELPGPSYSSVL